MPACSDVYIKGGIILYNDDTYSLTAGFKQYIEPTHLWNVSTYIV